MIVRVPMKDVATNRLDVKLNIIRTYRRNQIYGADCRQFGT